MVKPRVTRINGGFTMNHCASEVSHSCVIKELRSISIPLNYPLMHLSGPGPIVELDAQQYLREAQLCYLQGFSCCTTVQPTICLVPCTTIR